MMNEKPNYFKTRWAHPNFIEEQENLLSFFERKTPLNGMDLRGISLGGKNSHKKLSNYSFIRAEMMDVDSDFGNFETSFAQSTITFCTFRSAVFDHCIFNSAKISGSTFESAKFKSPSFQDNSFVDCSFLGASFSGSKILAYGGRRLLFEGCDFSDVTFTNLALTAIQFKKCKFNGTIFSKCSLAGAKFEDCQGLSDDSFKSCDIKSMIVNGAASNFHQPGGWEDKGRALLEKIRLDAESKKIP